MFTFGARAAQDDESALHVLGDFTANARLLLLSLVAIPIGIISAYVAVGLLSLINFFTNLFFFQRFSLSAASPAMHMLGWAVLAIPVIGGLIIGFMARYGSERIRGHGIPEAIESILIHGSRVEPKLAVLKPLSSAISIGSGGPFGAEGPIIMTGGAFGSLIAQFLHLSSAERKTLLVAGAAAGMSATFAAPLASVLLAVELLLFEWKPRSFVPVAMASATAAAARRYLLGLGPLFPVPAHPLFIGPTGLLGCVAVGLGAGALSALMTLAVYAAEDLFQEHVRVHWMWWPAMGGLAIGIGGLLFPQALGVGYDTIGALLQGDVARKTLLGILLVKSSIWAIALGSGTSGGVLAPLLMMGGALGGVEGAFLPNLGPGFWPLVSMGAILGGTMRSPLTGIVFAIELTHDLNMMLPLMVAVTIAHTFTVLTLRRSILTEKVSRRGFHLTREYSIDPLEILFVREVVRTNVVALSATMTLEQTRAIIGDAPRPRRRQRLYPVVDAHQRLLGVVTRSHLEHSMQTAPASMRIGDVAQSLPMVAYPDEPLRAIVHRMASTGLTRFPVVERGPERRLVGMVGLSDLLAGRSRTLDAEHRRERVFSLKLGRWAS
ncbi:MAG TPA: chloride channel protein [Vicinamibacterales bacterium]|jgi:H+/Cl- antiporter ClcA/CBS domain-containing protein|nr:chloride channel protein [Vicinamibacterales bacterium]